SPAVRHRSGGAARAGRGVPGALKELDTLPTETLTERSDALAAAAAGGPDAPWMHWMAAYHLLMRAALGERATRVLDEAAATALVGGELPIDRAFLEAAHAPPRGRLNVVVFERLAEVFEVSAREIWDALFPRRGKADRGYR